MSLIKVIEVTKYYNIAKTEWYKQIQTMFCAVILIKLVLGKKISKVNQKTVKNKKESAVKKIKQNFIVTCKN